MRKFDETYEKLMEQYRLDESFLGTLGNMVMAPLKAYKDAIVGAFKSTKIGQAFTELQGKNKSQPAEKAKGMQNIINEIKVILDETAKSSTKQITFRSKASKEEKFTIDDFFKNEKELDVKAPMMQVAKQSVASMDFSSMVDSSQNLIKSAIKTLTSDKEWKQENPDVKVNENEILSEIKKILKAQISRANTKVKFEDKLVWLYLLAPSTHKIQE